MSTASPASTSRKSAPSRSIAVVTVTALISLIVSTMQTLVIPIAPELPRLVNAAPSDTAWAVTATLLASVVVTPVMGRLGDMYGKRLMLLVSLSFLVAGSCTAALSDSLAPLIVGRTMQGLAAGVLPLGIAVLRDEIPPERLAVSTAVISASLGIGAALGLPAAALIAGSFDWHALFWLSGLLGALGALLVWFFIPEAASGTGQRFDLTGAVGLSAGLVCLLLAISEGADWGWSSALTLSLFAAAAIILVSWGRFELRAAQPLVDLRITARRQVLCTNLASFALGISMFAVSLVTPQLIQLPQETGHGLGKSMLVAGLVMAPRGLIMMLTAPLSAILTKSKGPRITLMTGALVVASGYVLNLTLMSEVWHLILVSGIIGAGVGFAYGALPALINGAVPACDTAAANSLNTLMRSLGASVSSAAVGVLLSQMTISVGLLALPSESGFRTTMAIGAGAALLAFAFAVSLPRD
ncbi:MULTISPECIES: MFS transporter [unclassified Streptomyces]|uniref:MFS transporter n=1 Tax=unclassified Streptomyces TaxID=2593676 RepID=UPI0035E3A5AF